MLGNLIGGFIVILIGVQLIPVVATSVEGALSVAGNNTNITGAAASIISLVTLFYALGIMAAGVSLAVNGLKNSGLM